MWSWKRRTAPHHDCESWSRLLVTDSSQDLLRTIFRNSFWSTFASIASPVLVFLFGGLTIRYVGIEAAGFSMAVGSILGIAGRFGTLGIGDAVLPAMAAAIGVGDRDRVRRLVGTLLMAAILSSCLTATALVIFSGPIVAWTRTKVPPGVAIAFITISAVSTVIGSLSGTMTGILSSACRHDLVTKVLLPLSTLSGIAGCILVPLFPSLITVALIGFVTGLITLVTVFALARRVVPETVRPTLSLVELPSLARYGFWISLTRMLSAMTGGIDDLMITAACGSAAVPPWSICKKLWLTVHTFLAQHTEHLIPTLGAIREKSRQTFESISDGMHWYVVVVAAAGYTFMAWAGPAIIAAAAGGKVAALCEIPLSSYSALGMFYSLTIIPVIFAMALSDARPGFVISLLSNSAQLLAVVVLVQAFGVPAAYYSPLFAIPFLIAALGMTSSRRLDPGSVWRRIRPVLVPLCYGLAGVVSSLLTPETCTLMQRALVGLVLSPCVLALILYTERRCGINARFHWQLVRVVRHAIEVVARVLRAAGAAFFPGAVEPRP